MTLEKILGYFGTYTAGVDGAVSSFQFEYLTSLGFAAIVIFLGHAIVKRSALLKKFAIPAPVVSGLLFSIAVAILKASGVMAFSFDVKTIQDLCQNIFFMCVGFGFSWKLIRHAGGKLCIMIAVAACLLITLQDVLGVLVGNLIGMDPYLALQCSSASMSGGVGTASAFGPIFIDWGAPESATTVGVTAGTLGNIMGSLIGGPVAAFLISRHHLKADPNDKPEAAADGKINELSNSRMVSMFGMVLLLCALGMPIYCILDNIPMIEMPKFIGCLFANVMEAAHIKFYTPEVDALEHMFLELYLALVLMTIDITALADVAGQMGIILLLQAALILLNAFFAATEIAVLSLNENKVPATAAGVAALVPMPLPTRRLLWISTAGTMWPGCCIPLSPSLSTISITPFSSPCLAAFLLTKSIHLPLYNGTGARI